jgi:hypothetical protein
MQPGAIFTLTHGRVRMRPCRVQPGEQVQHGSSAYMSSLTLDVPFDPRRTGAAQRALSCEVRHPVRFSLAYRYTDDRHHWRTGAAHIKLGVSQARAA